MKITLVYPDMAYMTTSPGYYYHGIGYLAAVLKQRGHAVSLLHITKPINKEEFCQRLADQLLGDGQDMVAFSATTNRFPYVETWSKWIKENFSAFIICGGVHPTLNPDSAIQAQGIDAICVGEGENAIVDLCNRLQAQQDISSIPNIWVKRGGKTHANPPRPLIQNLDTLPFPDRAIFDYPSLYHEVMGEASVMASRGCPYDCYYCCNRALSQIYKGQRYVRFRSVANVISELKQILTCYPFVRKFAFDDDVLPLKQDWFEQFAFEYRKEIGLPFNCNVWPGLVTEKLAKLLKEAGCHQVQMGIESGDPWIRSHVINRHISDKQIITAFKLCSNLGIKVYTYNMVGLPYESMKEILATIKLNAIVRPNMTQVSIFYPYHGTKLFDVCQQNSLLTDKDVRDYFEDTMLAFNPLARKQILFSELYFPLLVRVYAWLFKLPKRTRLAITRVIDAILISKATALLVFLPLIKLGSFIAQHELLLKCARALRQRFFWTSEHNKR